MKKVTIYLPDRYDECLSLTAIGSNNGVSLNVATSAFDLSKGTNLILERYDGLKVTWKQLKGDAE